MRRKKTRAEFEENSTPSAVEVALSEPPEVVDIVTPQGNARRGRILFITKGCVICHQVNGVGGAAAPALEFAATGESAVNPLEFSAHMWRGAAAMTALQALELGYVIELDAQDITDLAVFVGSEAEQKLLTIDSVGKEMREWFLNAPVWENDDWDVYRERGNSIPFDSEIPGEEPR